MPEMLWLTADDCFSSKNPLGNPTTLTANSAQVNQLLTDCYVIPFRFAQFFLCPLFTASATEREVNAVNSENEKNIPNDAWRLHQLEKATSNLNHPYSKFGTGSYCMRFLVIQLINYK